LEAQRDRLVGILDTMAGFSVGSIQVAHAMRDMAKVGVVEIMHAEGMTLIEKLRQNRSDAEKPSERVTPEERQPDEGISAMTLKQGDRLHLYLPEWMSNRWNVVIEVQAVNWAQAVLVPSAEDVQGTPRAACLTHVHRETPEMIPVTAVWKCATCDKTAASPAEADACCRELEAKNAELFVFNDERSGALAEHRAVALDDVLRAVVEEISNRDEARARVTELELKAIWAAEYEDAVRVLARAGLTPPVPEAIEKLIAETIVLRKRVTPEERRPIDEGETPR